ncbi:MAG: lysine--tRNA ligase [Patescibacteria group bacterium]
MASLDDLRHERIQKLARLRAAGRNPYPISTGQDITIFALLRRFPTLVKRRKPLTVVGRVLALRHQGALCFVDLDDGTGRIQTLLKSDAVGEADFNLFIETIDRGDFIGVTGHLGLTKREERTLFADNWQILAKALRPLPDKWHGLTDIEERFRRRYLDSLMDISVKQRFLTRSTIITSLREFLNAADYLEVETPILQPLYGGASAVPFQTHHAALDLPLYLRISPELYLKRLLVGGFPRVYELSRCFRNEGIDATHHPEFTMLEFYAAYSEASTQRAFVEQLVRKLVVKIAKASRLTFDTQVINFSEPFKVITYFDLLKRQALITNPETVDLRELTLKAAQFAITLPAGASRETVLDYIYKKVCRPKLIQPTFVIDYPKNALPLAKLHPDNLPPTGGLVDAFQLVIGGLEIAKAFSELNDPLDQAERFAAQESAKVAGDSEAQVKDQDFLEALEYGLPPAAGVGIGVDRLVMLLTDQTNIREVIYFPTLRPK